MQPSPHDLAHLEERLAFLADQHAALHRHPDRIEVVADIARLATVIPLAEIAIDPSWPSVTVLPWVVADWCVRLAGAGFAHVENMAFLERPVEPPIEIHARPGVVVERVADLAAADAFAAIQAACFTPADEPQPERWLEHFRARARHNFANPHIVYLVARIGGEVRAITVVQISGNAAGLYLVGTRADARGQGLATLLLREAQDRAAAAGCLVLKLQSIADSDAYGIYTKCGFVERFRAAIWRRHGA